MKIFQIPHVIFQTTSQFFFKFCMTLLSWNILLCTFLGQTLYTLHKRDQSKCKFFRLFGAQIKIHQILVIFETKNKFLFKFCTILIVHIAVSNSLKNTTPLFLPRPPLNQQTLQSPLFRQTPPPPPPLYFFFVNAAPKSQIFQWNPKILKFFILNTILPFKGN